MAISDEQLAAGLRESERRLQASRQLRDAQFARLRYGCAGAVALLLLVSLGLGVRARAAVAPQLLVTWPALSEGTTVGLQQTVADGATVLLRHGKPLGVTVQDAADWNLKWLGDDVQTFGPVDQWDPVHDRATLSVSCRRVAHGWRRIFDFLSPTRTLQLHGISATPTAKFGLSLNPPPGGAWIYCGVLARSPVSWDERVLPLLVQVFGVNTGSGNSPDWLVVPSFDQTSRLPDDTGSYFTLTSPTSPNIQTDLPRLAGAMCRLQPKTSVKFIVRLDRRPPTGVVRLTVDYKGTRGGWIRRPGSRAGEPVRGWGSIAPGSQLPPSLPRAVGTPARPRPTVAPRVARRPAAGHGPL